MLMKRKWVDFFKSKTKRIFMSLFMKKAWGTKRKLPQIAETSFHEDWMEKHKPN